MILIYRLAALRDMTWVRRYYRDAFPEGRARAAERLIRAEDLIAANPYAGHPSDHFPDAREFPIPRVPFTLVYRIHQDRIEILRLLDQRGMR